jgi:hypothetical protein
VTDDPKNPQRLATCAPGSIQVSQDGGQTWKSISTQGVAQIATQQNHPLFQNQNSGQPACSAVTLDPAYPNSFYAVFQTMAQQYGAPPIFFMGFTTQDAGKSWKAAPVPNSQLQENFGGFWAGDQGVVQALYSGQTTGPEQAPPVIVEQTTDGGQTWSPGSLICPAGGPCLRWGPAPGSIPGMGSPLPQWVYVSTDGEKSWSTPGPQVELRLSGPHELVAYSGQAAAVFSGSGDYPLQVTQDGGKTWNTVSLPPLPGGDVSGPLFPGLQTLPDGALLAQPETNQPWALLPANAHSWCSLPANQLPSQPVLLVASGSRLWWQDPQTLQAHSVPLANLKCGG